MCDVLFPPQVYSCLFHCLALNVPVRVQHCYGAEALWFHIQATSPLRALQGGTLAQQTLDINTSRTSLSNGGWIQRMSVTLKIQETRAALRLAACWRVPAPYQLHTFPARPHKPVLPGRASLGFYKSPLILCFLLQALLFAPMYYNSTVNTGATGFLIQMLHNQPWGASVQPNPIPKKEKYIHKSWHKHPHPPSTVQQGWKLFVWDKYKYPKCICDH